VPGSASGPFTLDIVKPDAQVFQAEAPATSGAGGEPPSDSSTDSGSGSGFDTGSGGSGEAFLPGAFEAPPAFDAGVAEAPLVAGGADAAPPPRPARPRRWPTAPPPVRCRRRC
jgi:hypothetical protein